MARVVKIESKKTNPYLDDKSFIIKFVSLLSAILILATLGIYHDDQGLNIEFKKMGSIKYKSLDEIERTLNKKSIDTTLNEDDFNSLSDLDLSSIELATAQKNYKEDSLKKISSVGSVAKKRVNKKIVISSKDTKSEVKKSSNIIITSKPIGSKNSSIQKIKKRFYKSHSFPLAIKIAQQFLSKKSYKRSLKWALIANEIDTKSEKSWILFAKSKVALGQKKDAINALSEYLKNHKSSNVKTLLDDIKNSRKI